MDYLDLENNETYWDTYRDYMTDKIIDEKEKAENGRKK
jgi:hypothetical protein